MLMSTYVAFVISIIIIILIATGFKCHITGISGVLLTGATHFLRWVLLSVQSQFVENSKREIKVELADSEPHI